MFFSCIGLKGPGGIYYYSVLQQGGRKKERVTVIMKSPTANQRGILKDEEPQISAEEGMTDPALISSLNFNIITCPDRD
jgi:hypothetical protein